jgi:hypothetical protein
MPTAPVVDPERKIADGWEFGSDGNGHRSGLLRGEAGDGWTHAPMVAGEVGLEDSTFQRVALLSHYLASTFTTLGLR